MYSLTYRPCVGRRVTRSLDLFARFNSSNNAPVNPPVPSTANNSAPTSFRAVEASSNAPIASSWDNITIPSREEILQKPRKFVPGHDRGKLYRPDLSYLRKGSSTSFASRLAAEAAQPADGAASEPAKKPSPKQPKQEQKERQRRVAEATAQRKAERLAREAAQKAKVEAKPAQRRASAYEGVETALQKVERRGQQSGQRDQQRSRGGSASHGGRGGMRKQNVRGAARPPPVPVVRRTPTTEINQTESNEDITLEVLEQGGDDKAPAEFKNPDFPVTNLDDLFGPSPDARLENATRAMTPFTDDQVQWLRETYGGDYLRIAPQSDADFATEPRELGPLKHAHLVLSKRRDVAFGARKDALTVIASALGDAGNKGVQRA
ncbi:hypothetical protein D9615_001249 [Tricholomella constricta]|uniref:Uncharacterized protein n=1 Tax=Tricholomella constricta TaxID=117010 RepID=A0A8H5HLB0_9AGAR|nr:hypothetical protein D9615_001249 [Tricholomella constricta]